MIAGFSHTDSEEGMSYFPPCLFSEISQIKLTRVCAGKYIASAQASNGLFKICFYALRLHAIDVANDRMRPFVL